MSDGAAEDMATLLTVQSTFEAHAIDWALLPAGSALRPGWWWSAI